MCGFPRQIIIVQMRKKLLFLYIMIITVSHESHFKPLKIDLGSSYLNEWWRI